jgi:tetrahydromethanopterin S-methyltransferase subunit C
MVTGYGLEASAGFLTSGVIQADSVARIASYPMGTGSSLAGSKAAGA